VEYAFLSTALLMNVIFPLMSAARGRGDTGRFAELYRRGTECLVLITLALPVLLLFIARPLAEQVLGPEYVRADVPLVLLATAMVLLVVNVWQSLVLLLGGHQRTTLRYSLAALGVSAVSSVLLISALGLVGAGVAAVVTALFVSTVSTLSVRRLMAVRLELGPLLRIAAAAGLCAGVLAALSATSLPWPALAALGLLAYAVASRLTGAHHSFGGLIS
jgi:O-antigen/teichoic acid export membrane protein